MDSVSCAIYAVQRARLHNKLLMIERLLADTNTSSVRIGLDEVGCQHYGILAVSHDRTQKMFYVLHHFCQQVRRWLSGPTTGHSAPV